MHDSDRQENCALEIKVCFRLPFLEGLQCLTQSLTTLDIRQKFHPLSAGARSVARDCAQNPAEGREEARLGLMTSRSKKNVESAWGRTSLPIFWTESPTAPLRDQLIARQSGPRNDSLRASPVGHHAKRQLITPEIAAEPVVQDVDLHLPLPPDSFQPFVLMTCTMG